MYLTLAHIVQCISSASTCLSFTCGLVARSLEHVASPVEHVEGLLPTVGLYFKFTRLQTESTIWGYRGLWSFQRVHQGFLFGVARS